MCNSNRRSPAGWKLGHGSRFLQRSSGLVSPSAERERQELLAELVRVRACRGVLEAFYLACAERLATYEAACLSLDRSRRPWAPRLATYTLDELLAVPVNLIAALYADWQHRYQGLVGWRPREGLRLRGEEYSRLLVLLRKLSGVGG